MHLQTAEPHGCLHDDMLIIRYDAMAVSVYSLHPANSRRISKEGQKLRNDAG
jgi:hypothetical protein